MLFDSDSSSYPETNPELAQEIYKNIERLAYLNTNPPKDSYVVNQARH